MRSRQSLSVSARNSPARNPAAIGPADHDVAPSVQRRAISITNRSHPCDNFTARTAPGSSSQHDSPDKKTWYVGRGLRGHMPTMVSTSIFYFPHLARFYFAISLEDTPVLLPHRGRPSGSTFSRQVRAYANLCCRAIVSAGLLQDWPRNKRPHPTSPSFYSLSQC